MPEKGTVHVKVIGDLTDLRKGLGTLGREPFKLRLDDKAFSQPLGRITGKLGEFDKSLEASNARVIAFGASAGAIMGVQRALKATVSAAIEVEKSLTDINVILGAGEKSLARFGDQLFKIASNTGQSFKVVATAATELARQGLSVEETLRRTSDALVLTRLSGLDAVSSVESLTASINSFNRVALTSTEIVNKLANVDAAFAVSSADLAEALRRVGSTASDAGVSFDQLIAAVTSAQQVTARGGSVIGNSFKTIFTRLQRPAVLQQLEQLGIKTKGLGDTARPVIGILTDLSKVYDKLASSQRAQISELIGGVFQINIVKAALSDLGKEYSIYDRALATSVSSTNEAIARNEELNKTLSALINKTFANLQKVGARAGEGAFAPAIKNVLGFVNKALGDSAGEKGAEDFGGKVAQGIFKGLGDFLSGPGLVLGASLMLKMFTRLTITLTDAFKTIAAQNKQTALKVKLEKEAFGWLSRHPDILQKIKNGTISIRDAERAVGESIQRNTTELNEQYIVVKNIVSGLMASKKLS
jgi:TP901 family phage tail tape measure protein